MAEQVMNFVTWLNEQSKDEGYKDIIKGIVNVSSRFPVNPSRRQCKNWLAANSTIYEYLESVDAIFDQYDEYLLRKAGEIGDEARIYADYPADTPGSTKLDMLED